MFTKRQGIVVWFKHIKQLRKLRRFGHVIYASKRQKYAVIYVNQEEVSNIVEQLERLHFVKNVDLSYKPYVDTAYQGAVEKTHDLDAELEGYYQSGI
ncbi:YlbG family protein [Alkalibacillus haloalkaliphilus]|uniref:YlbG family protein n=1 Tax=Alkalibacillus haloalkaliphilus TaxID=94136 RepID=UPI002936AB29|nr:DUF2129 domain-containing protein [Alkalibacillus haloalkaliphilus]MDV2582513.1 DUF2129 domain-containing protein [Alkalibacillus haloalkaliphilus]